MKKLMLTTALLATTTQLASAMSFEHYFNLKSSAPSKTPADVLYIQTANNASLTQLNKSKQSYQLTLSGVNPMVTYFSDRPERLVGQIGNAVYLQTWNQGGKQSFDKDAPNAVVSGVANVNGKSKNVNVVMELSNPVVNMKKHTITYDAESLSSTETKLNLNHANLHYTTVFIDGGFCAACIG
jgi:hypothetical protein